MCSLLGKRSCSFELELTPAKRRMVDFESSNFLSSEEFQLFPELASGIEDDFILDHLNALEDSSTILHENYLLELEGELLLPLVLAVEERRQLANIRICTRDKNHDEFDLYDQLQILDKGSAFGFLQSLGKQRLVTLNDIYSLCTKVTVNLIGSGNKLVLKKTCFNRTKCLTSLVFDKIEDGKIDFYIGVNKGPDRSLYKLEIIFHCASGDHKILISGMVGAGHKYESGKKIKELKERSANNNCVSVILDEESNVKLELK